MRGSELLSFPTLLYKIKLYLYLVTGCLQTRVGIRHLDLILDLIINIFVSIFKYLVLSVVANHRILFNETEQIIIYRL